MKKILTFLITIITVGFIVAGLYVFGLPPFQNGSPLSPAAPQVQTQQSQTALPDFLTQAGVTRAQTYEEHMNRGQLLEQNQFYTLAIAEYQQANQLDPTNFDPLMKIGRIELQTGDYAKAETNFQQALNLDPGNVDIEVFLGRTLLQERKIDQAQTVFNGITQDNQTSIYYKGIIAAYYGNYDSSKTFLNQAVSMGGAADITQKAQNFLAAYSEFDFNQGGQTIHLQTLLGRSYAQTGEYQMAIPLLFNVIQQEKDYRDAWIILGYSYLNIGQYQDAVDALNQAKELDPQKPETFFYLGLAYYNQNNLQLAATNLEQAKSLGFQPVIQVDQKLAEIYLELNQYDKSATEYQNVVSLNDTDINYYIRPLWLYLEKLNEPGKAVELAQKAFADHPNEPMSFNLIGWAQVGNGQFTAAAQNLTKAIQMDPTLDAAYLNLGWLYEKQGDYQQALAYYVKAHDLGKGNSISNAAAQKYDDLIAKVKTNTNIGQANLIGP